MTVWRGVTPSVVLGLLLIVALAPGVQAPHTEQSGRYVTGGAFFGTGAVCFHALPFDIGAACDLLCPQNPCTIFILDDYYGDSVYFLVCVEDEDGCRPWLYENGDRFWGAAGKTLTIMPTLFHSTTGIVTIR